MFKLGQLSSNADVVRYIIRRLFSSVKIRAVPKLSSGFGSGLNSAIFPNPANIRLRTKFWHDFRISVFRINCCNAVP